jgi:rare lipoprotein A
MRRCGRGSPDGCREGGAGVRRRAPRAFAVVVVTLVAACAPQPTRPPSEPTVSSAPGAPPTPPTAPPATPPAPPIATPPAPSSPASAAPAAPTPAFSERGRISTYGDGDGFDGKTTASGEPFDADALTMAHPTLPFGTRVRVTNLENHKSVEVVVNDRGPRVRDRIADLSTAAARRLGMVGDGVVEALLEVVKPARKH